MASSLFRSLGRVYRKAVPTAGVLETTDESRETVAVDKTVRDSTEILREMMAYYGTDAGQAGLMEEFVHHATAGLTMFNDGDDAGIRRNPDAGAALEAIVRTDGSRPSFMVENDRPVFASSPAGRWKVELEKREAALAVAVASVGRMDTPGAFSDYQGTGFLIAPNLILTNRHVLQLVARPTDGGWKLSTDAAIDFGHEFKATETKNRRKLKRVLFAGSKPIAYNAIDHGKLDLALIELEDTANFTQVPFKLQGAAASDGAMVATVGYPGPPRERVYSATLLERLFKKTYGYKRLAPGEIIASRSSRLAWTLAHDATTLGGNSGSAVLLLDDAGVALGLHYGGQAMTPAENWCHLLEKVWGETDGRAADTLFAVLEKHGVALAGPPPAPRRETVTSVAALTEDVPFLRPGGGETAESVARLTPAQQSRLAERVVGGAVSEGAAETVAAGGSPEIVLGRSNFLPASFLAVGTATANATAFVRASGTDFRGRTGSWSGTGFLLSPNILLTNHHVLNSPAVAAGATAVFNFQTEPDGTPGTTASFRLNPQRLFITSPIAGGLDYTFCWVDGEPGRRFGTVRAARQTFGIAEGEFANIVSHPAGRMKEVSLQENLVRWQDDLVVHYTSDTEPGSSGAAVCNNAWSTVALHHASKASPAGGTLNEGIKLAAIAADLERLGTPAAREALALFGGTDERLGFFGRLGRRPIRDGGVEAVVDSFAGTEQDLDIGFWNVEWLANRWRTKTAAVAKIIREMNLDLWSLEEASPAALAALLVELRERHGLEYDGLAAEPDKPEDLQSCVVIWNTATVTVEREAWGDEIDAWLKAHSRDFDDLGLGEFEAVEGKIFDRYPTLFRVSSLDAGPTGAALEFYFVPLHLKAMAEGSKRRRMASKILAVAAAEKAAAGDLKDFVIGGDANAPLGSGDFANLTDAGLIAVGAEDAEHGAFSYIKGPKSLIDHVFLSPNLVATAPAEFVVVAAEKTIPKFVREISDHRPVLVRLSMGGAADDGGTEAAVDNSKALKKLKEKLKKERRDAGTPEAAVSGGTGYDPNFLGTGGRAVPLPGFTDATEDAALVVNPSKTGIAKYVLPYTHFSVVMNRPRRLQFYSAVNIDGTQEKDVPEKRRWHNDSRIPKAAQVGTSWYSNSGFSKGHMVRRLDPVWGPRAVAVVGEDDTHAYPNAVPQMQEHNAGIWLQLEDFVLRNANNRDFKACVFTGPVLRADDKRKKGVQIPREFWKVAAMVNAATGKLTVTAYLQSQQPWLPQLEWVYADEPKTYQVPLATIAELTGLDFHGLDQHDPLNAGGAEAAVPAVEITGPDSLVF